MQHADVIIVGAGIAGLSLAYELTGRGRSVIVIEQGQAGRRASWAAAGILPAVCRTGLEHDDFERLKSLSWQLYPDWIQRLTNDSSVDPEYQRLGGIHLATSPAELISLQVAVKQWLADGIRVQPISSLPDWRELEPALEVAVREQRIQGGFWLPDECIVRPPRLLQALLLACRQRQVAIVEQVSIRSWQRQDERLIGIETNQGWFGADQFCLAAGAWSTALAASCGVDIDVQPWRGQMILFRAAPGLTRTVINQGPNYLVPRQDGRILVGSTMEEVGFDESNTEAALEGIKAFAVGCVSSLNEALIERIWAGLRPGTGDSWPLLGRTAAVPNLFVSTGHFRSGISLAPATARVVAQQMLGDPPDVSLQSFDVGRK